MTQAERRATTRRAVLEAAAACFDEAGYLATRLDDVTALANLTKGAVYFHFGSKEALAHALIDDQRMYWPAVVDEVVSRPGTGLDHLVHLTYELLRQLRENAKLRAGMRLAAERDVPGVDPADLFEEWTGRAEDLLRRARRAGVLAADASPAAVARVVVAFLLGEQHLAAVTDGHDPKRRLDEFWALLLPRLQASK